MIPQNTSALAQLYHTTYFTPQDFYYFAIYKISDSKNPIFTLQLLAYKFGLKPGMVKSIPNPYINVGAIDLNINVIYHTIGTNLKP